jgi:hypothetical protein
LPPARHHFMTAARHRFIDPRARHRFIERCLLRLRRRM